MIFNGITEDGCHIYVRDWHFISIFFPSIAVTTACNWGYTMMLILFNAFRFEPVCYFVLASPWLLYMYLSNTSVLTVNL